MNDADSHAEEYQRLRPLLFSIAYNMTGSVADAEDIVSEAFLRLHRAHADGTVIASMKSYLSTVVSRLSISHLAEHFFAAVETGDLDGLVDLLAADVVTYGDGGGRGPSLPKPVYGRDKALRLLAALSTALRRYHLHLERGTVNAQPGALVRDASGALLNVLSVDVFGGRVQTIHSILNPDKLGHLGPLAGPDHPLRRGARHTRPE